jgi:hypothetical protein
MQNNPQAALEKRGVLKVGVWIILNFTNTLIREKQHGEGVEKTEKAG